MVLGLVWQMMKAYTLCLLKKLNKKGTAIAKKDILAWQEKKMTKAGKTPIKSFQVVKSKVSGSLFFSAPMLFMRGEVWPNKRGTRESNLSAFSLKKLFGAESIEIYFYIFITLQIVSIKY